MKVSLTLLFLLVITHYLTSIHGSLPPTYQNITFLTEKFAQAKTVIRSLISGGQVRAPILVRLAWHDAGTYCKYCSSVGGPHALMRFPGQAADPANNGLETARDPLATVYSQGFSGNITLADFWQFGAVVAIDYMGGPHVPFRPGRDDWETNRMTPFDRLPDGAFGFPDFETTPNYIRDIFNRMGFNDTEMVALIGAHTLGECHQEWSGFNGPWTPEPDSFTNLFFQELVNDPFTLTPGTKQYQDSIIPGLIMLHTDIALIHDSQFLTHVKKYAQSQQAWFDDFTSAFAKLQAGGVSSLLPPIDW